MSIIEMNQVSKSFGNVQALKEVDLKVDQGEAVGFLGPNGAGKSTTLRILLGLLRKSGGQMRLFGGDPWEDAVELHRRLAYVPGDVNLWPNLSGGEVIDLFGALRGGMDHAKREELIERFKLDPTKKCGTYSTGNRQKVALIAAFATDFDLLIVDEPTSGLDPLMAAVFQECVKEVKQEGKTILLSSHILSEVEALCDRVSIIREGTIIESGTLTELRHLTRTSVSVETEKSLTGLEELSGVHDITMNGPKQVKFQVDSEEIGHIIRHITSFNIESLTCTPPTLEELFMRHYEGNNINPKNHASPIRGERE